MALISTRWQIVGALFAMMMFSSGLGFYNQSVLLEALTRERGFSVAAAALASTVFFATSGFAGLAVASVIERIDARWSVAAGVAVCAVALVAIGRVEETTHVYAAFVLFGPRFLRHEHADGQHARHAVVRPGGGRSRSRSCSPASLPAASWSRRSLPGPSPSMASGAAARFWPRPT